MSDQINTYSEDNILILKGRFKSNSMNLFGQLIIIFNNDKKFDTYNVVVSSFSDLYNFEPHRNWNELEEMIADTKWKGSYNNSMTASVLDTLTRFSQEMNSVELLFDNIFEYNYSEVDVTLYDIINRIIHDKNLILETSIEEISTEQFNKVKAERSKVPSKDSDDNSNESSADQENAVILPIKPILSPVKGKPLYEIKIGDRIMMKIEAGSDRASYFIDLLNLREDNKIKAAPATVIDIKAGSGKKDPIEVLTEIGPGVFGKFYEDEKQVKLKLFDPKSDTELDDASFSQKSTAAPRKSTASASSPAAVSRSTIIMMAVLLLVLIVFIAFIIIIL